MVHSHLTGGNYETEEEKDAAEEAFRQRVKTANPAERRTNSNIEQQSSGMWNNLKALMGRKN